MRRFITVAVVVFAATFGAACTTSSTTRGAVASAHPVAVEAQRPSRPTADDLAALRASLAARRSEQLARLEEYAAAGVFPRNTTSPTPLHMLRDADGRYCAVANLVHLDGLDRALDAEIAAAHNDLQFADVKDGALHEWILGSGLTQEEVARIQAPAPQMMVDAPAAPDYPLPAKPKPQPKAAPLPTEEMVADQLRAHFRAVEQEIRDSTDASLDLAVARLTQDGHDSAVAVSAN